MILRGQGKKVLCSAIKLGDLALDIFLWAHRAKCEPQLPREPAKFLIQGKF